MSLITRKPTKQDVRLQTKVNKLEKQVENLKASVNPLRALADTRRQQVDELKAEIDVLSGFNMAVEEDKSSAAHAIYRMIRKWSLVRTQLLGLTPHQRSKAEQGLRRHITACLAIDVEYEIDCFQEIIKDAANNRFVFEESLGEFLAREKHFDSAGLTP